MFSFNNDIMLLYVLLIIFMYVHGFININTTFNMISFGKKTSFKKKKINISDWDCYNYIKILDNGAYCILRSDF